MILLQFYFWYLQMVFSFYYLLYYTFLYTLPQFHLGRICAPEIRIMTTQPHAYLLEFLCYLDERRYDILRPPQTSHHD